MLQSASHPFGPDVHLIEVDGKSIYLIGTAHVSATSVSLVEQVIRSVNPRCVAVELCAPRYSSLRDPEAWKKSDIIKVFREGKSYVLLLQLLIANYQKRLGDKLHIRPGQEMLTASRCADELGARIALIDRDVKTTLRRAWATMSMWSVFKLLLSALFASTKEDTVSEQEIERLKSADALQDLMGEFSRDFPGIRNVLIDERDTYMAEKLRRLPDSSIVAVVGAGHVPGMLHKLTERHSIEALDSIPPPSPASRIIGWGIPLAFLAVLALGMLSAGGQMSLAMLEAWVWATGIWAAVGALLTLAHPLTVLTAFVVAPITTLHPLLAAGWFAGLSEALLRKPQVGDFETVVDDIGSLRGMYRNRISRILLIMVATNLTATIGAIWGAKKIVELVA